MPETLRPSTPQPARERGPDLKTLNRQAKEAAKKSAAKAEEAPQHELYANSLKVGGPALLALCFRMAVQMPAKASGETFGRFAVNTARFNVARCAYNAEMRECNNDIAMAAWRLHCCLATLLSMQI